MKTKAIKIKFNLGEEKIGSNRLLLWLKCQWKLTIRGTVSEKEIEQNKEVLIFDDSIFLKNKFWKFYLLFMEIRCDFATIYFITYTFT